MSWIYQPAEILILAGLSCVTGPAKLIEMVQYFCDSCILYFIPKVSLLHRNIL